MGDGIWKTTLQTFQTFITVEIRLQEPSGSFFSSFLEVLMRAVSCELSWTL